ncbi:MAG: hypothetical protein MZV70_39365 [Desulfobacterales bacterium]|nr:hypothetical protein [Desulfobacterales bacterium]
MIQNTARGQHKAQQVAHLQRQRNAGKAADNTTSARIPRRSIRATTLGCRGGGD